MITVHKAGHKSKLFRNLGCETIFAGRAETECFPVCPDRIAVVLNSWYSDGLTALIFATTAFQGHPLCSGKGSNIPVGWVAQPQ
jgi:hypothetical protein